MQVAHTCLVDMNRRMSALHFADNDLTPIKDSFVPASLTVHFDKQWSWQKHVIKLGLPSTSITQTRHWCASFWSAANFEGSNWDSVSRRPHQGTFSNSLFMGILFVLDIRCLCHLSFDVSEPIKVGEVHSGPSGVIQRHQNILTLVVFSVYLQQRHSA